MSPQRPRNELGAAVLGVERDKIAETMWWRRIRMRKAYLLILDLLDQVRGPLLGAAGLVRSCDLLGLLRPAVSERRIDSQNAKTQRAALHRELDPA